MESFLSEKGRTLAEFKAKIHVYRELSREITALDDVVFFDMFQLECHDIKHGLNEIVQDLTLALVRQLASQHKEENQRFVERCPTSLSSIAVCRICSEYERFRSQALKVPDDSREMMDLIAYMETVKGGLVQSQWEAVQGSLNTLTYLLDIHTFSTQEMQLNRVTLTWPEKLNPIFQENERIIEESKVSTNAHMHMHMHMHTHVFWCLQVNGEKDLTEKQEKVIIEVEKCHRRVEEFSEYSDLSCMQQYCKEVTL